MSASRMGTLARTREEVDDTHGRERIAGFRDGRRGDGDGHPAGAGRRAPSPMRVLMLGAMAASVTSSVISDWSTRDCRVYRSGGRRVQSRGQTTF
jgi:hypothetical protein